MPDVLVEWHGSIVLVYAFTADAVAWMCENVEHEDEQFSGGGRVVEPRYLHAMLDGMLADGLVVQGAAF